MSQDVEISQTTVTEFTDEQARLLSKLTPHANITVRKLQKSGHTTFTCSYRPKGRSESWSVGGTTVTEALQNALKDMEAKLSAQQQGGEKGDILLFDVRLFD